MTYKI